MLALLLSLVVLLFTWTTAHLLAVPAGYLLKLTHLDQRLNLRGIYPFNGPNRLVFLRGLIFVLLIIIQDLLLAALLGVEPLHLMWKNYVQEFVDFELTQTLMNGLVDNLALSLGIFLVFQAARFINTFFPRLLAVIDGWRRTRFNVVRFKQLELLTPDQITNFLVSLARYLQIGLNLVLGLVGLTFALSFFPGTQDFAFRVIDLLAELLVKAGTVIWSFVPNMLTLLMIAVITRYSLKLLSFFYNGFRKGRIRFPGLHPELAEPTYQLLRFFVVTLGLVAAYPYIPGSDSPVFRGITIFAGFLLSLGSTSLVTNIVSGVVLTYTRGLRIGDRVKIGQTTGDVVERTLLVTRVRTIKNVVITIPNGMVLNNEIINYSQPIAESELILHTTVTIGYDVPWRQVHHLLEQAALATRDILPAPAPFVLQTSLDDYYVSYELNACTHIPERMAAIYSELHQNIQDWFNEAGVEIMSPAFTAYRDGDEVTIPAHYRRPGIQPPKPSSVFFPPRKVPIGGVDTLPLNKHGIKTRPL